MKRCHCSWLNKVRRLRSARKDSRHKRLQASFYYIEDVVHQVLGIALQTFFSVKRLEELLQEAQKKATVDTVSN